MSDFTEEEQEGLLKHAVQECSIGQLLAKDALILRNHIGTAKNGDDAYELSYTMGGLPLVRYENNGRWFTLSWQDMINLAIAAGIEEAA